MVLRYRDEKGDEIILVYELVQRVRIFPDGSGVRHRKRHKKEDLNPADVSQLRAAIEADERHT